MNKEKTGIDSDAFLSVKDILNKALEKTLIETKPGSAGQMNLKISFYVTERNIDGNKRIKEAVDISANVTASSKTQIYSGKKVLDSFMFEDEGENITFFNPEVSFDEYIEKEEAL